MTDEQVESSVAIVAMDGIFPRARNIEALWELLISGKSGIEKFSMEELREEGLDERYISNKNFVPFNGIIPDVEKFNPELFRLNLTDSKFLDPQHRMFLMLCHNLLEKSGKIDDTDKNVGVFVCNGLNTYLLENIKNSPFYEQIDPINLLINSDKDFLSTRISYHFNFIGPSMMIQSACSSSLVAVHQASLALLNYECNLALAGGISITIPQKRGHIYKTGSIFSKDGVCKPFDEEATGTVAGNGGGAVLLKRYQEAIDDGDTIIAVIRGSAVNNDGRQKVGYAAPSEEGQRYVMERALDVAQVDPGQVGYVETHGTGTPIGDPIEFRSMSAVYNHSDSTTHLGAIKANIGHLNVASGIAGLIKTALILNRQMIPPQISFDRPNRLLNFDRLTINTEAKQCIDHSLEYAAVSSFGLGGTNAHLILQQAPVINSFKGYSSFSTGDGSYWIEKADYRLVDTYAEGDLSDNTSRVRETVEKIWKQVLGVEAVESQSDFFALGGQSIHAVELVDQIKRAFNVNLDLAGFVKNATLESMVHLIEKEKGKCETR